MPICKISKWWYEHETLCITSPETDDIAYSFRADTLPKELANRIRSAAGVRGVGTAEFTDEEIRQIIELHAEHRRNPPAVVHHQSGQFWGNSASSAMTFAKRR